MSNFVEDKPTMAKCCPKCDKYYPYDCYTEGCGDYDCPCDGCDAMRSLEEDGDDE
jgi:hypothetical protein